MKRQADHSEKGDPVLDALEPRILLSGDAALPGIRASASAFEPVVCMPADPSPPAEPVDQVGGPDLLEMGHELDCTHYRGPNNEYLWWTMGEDVEWEMGSLQWVSFENVWNGQNDQSYYYWAEIALETCDIWGGNQWGCAVMYHDPLFNNDRTPAAFEGFSCYVNWEDGRSDALRAQHQADAESQHGAYNEFCSHQSSRNLGFQPGQAVFTIRVSNMQTHRPVDLFPDVDGVQDEVALEVTIVNSTDLEFTASAGQDAIARGHDYYFEWTGLEYDHIELYAVDDRGWEHEILNTYDGEGYSIDANGWIVYTGNPADELVIDQTNLPRGFRWTAGNQADPGSSFPLDCGQYSFKAEVHNCNAVFGGYTYGVEYARTVNVTAWMPDRWVPDTFELAPHLDLPDWHVRQLMNGGAAATPADPVDEVADGPLLDLLGSVDRQAEPAVTTAPVYGPLPQAPAQVATSGSDLGDNLLDVLGKAIPVL